MPANSRWDYFGVKRLENGELIMPADSRWDYFGV